MAYGIAILPIIVSPCIGEFRASYLEPGGSEDVADEFDGQIHNLTLH
jgi:hypothetical protein